MKLYSFFNSSTSYRVRIALAIKGLDYEYEGVNLREGAQHAADFRIVNPSKAVPVLVSDTGDSFTQSLSIIQQLDDEYPQPRLIPEDAWLKARVLELSYAIACDIHPVNNVRILHYLRDRLNASEEQVQDWYGHWIEEGFEAVEAMLRKYRKPGSQYCFGNQVTLAECCLVPQYANALRMNCNVSGYPMLSDVYRNCTARPDFRRADPSNQPDYIK